MSTPEQSALGRPTGEGARIDMAKKDLQESRRIDLASATNADLVLAVEALRGRLDDVLRVVDAHPCFDHGQDQR